MLDPLPLFAVAFLTFLLAGFVKGMIGMGLPVVAMGLLGLVVTPGEAAALLVVPSLVTNIWQLAAGPRFGWLAKRLWPLLLTICIGVWAGSGQLTGPESGRTIVFLGLLLMAYAGLGLSAVHFVVPARFEGVAAPAVGLVTGFIAAATGIFTIPMVPYLNALNLERDDLVQGLGLAFTVCSLALGTSLFHDGALGGTVLWQSALALIPTGAGMVLGTKLRGKVEPMVFRRYFLLGLLVLGADLALRRLF